MGSDSKTLYGVLGVEPGVDEQCLVRAYREQVKRHHPDVTDAPDARATFRRLTTAKAVLTDAEERARYDRLGHETYVQRHLDDGWPTDDREEAAGDSGGRGEAVSEAAQRMAARTASATAEPRETQQADRNDGYATASEYYRPGQRVGVEARGGLARTLGGVRTVLPWLLAHLALLVSAIAVAFVLLTGTSSGGLPPITSLFVAAAMVGVTAGVSALHLSTTLFR